MKLTRTTDFAIRVLTFLARVEQGSTMPELSKALAIPYNNLTKIIVVLSKGGLVQTKKGKYGGIQLLKDPKDISIKVVVELIDGPTMLSECLNGKTGCGFDSACKIKRALSDIQTKINHLMDDVRIAQLV